jgi:hypothetical protein
MSCLPPKTGPWFKPKRANAVVSCFMSMTTTPNRKPTSNPFFDEMAQGWRAAMLYDLLRRELGDWQARENIRIAGLVEQQNVNLDPFDDWWIDLLERQQLPGAGSKEPNVALSHVWEDEGVCINGDNEVSFIRSSGKAALPKVVERKRQRVGGQIKG